MAIKALIRILLPDALLLCLPSKRLRLTSLTARLLEKLGKHAGRNNTGKMTVRHQGGGQ